MKKLKLIMLFGLAMLDNTDTKHWIILFSGHLNLFEIKLWPHGWVNRVQPLIFSGKTTSDDDIEAACTFIEQNLSNDAADTAFSAQQIEAIFVNGAKILGDANA